MSDAPRGLLNWWQGLILATSSAILGVVAAIYIKDGGSAPGGQGPSWAMILLRFVPHFLLLFGVLADAFTYEGVYWTGTMVGVIATFVAPWLDAVGAGAMNVLASLMRKAPRGGGAFPSSTLMNYGGPVSSTATVASAGYLGCSLMADGKAGSVPQTLVVSASILAYYIFDLVLNMSLLDAAGAIAAALMLYGGQTAAISGCLDEGKTGQAAVFAGIYGIIIGGASYGVISTWGPSYLPSTVIGGSITSGGGADGRIGVGAGRRGGAGGMGMSAGNPAGPPPLADGSGAPGQKKTCPS